MNFSTIAFIAVLSPLSAISAADFNIKGSEAKSVVFTTRCEDIVVDDAGTENGGED